MSSHGPFIEKQELGTKQNFHVKEYLRTALLPPGKKMMHGNYHDEYRIAALSNHHLPMVGYSDYTYVNDVEFSQNSIRISDDFPDDTLSCRKQAKESPS